MNIPKELKYTKTHEWIKIEGASARVGITDHAQHEISDVVHLELPETGRELKKGDTAAVVESVKAAFDIYSPVSGAVSNVNDEALNAPEKINSDPYGAGWLFELKSGSLNADTADLMDAKGYEEYLSKKAD